MELKENAFFDLTKTRTFGRLKGRRLTKNQAIGLDQFHSKMAFDSVKGLDFIKKKECWIEIGFGNGEHLIYQAIERKEVNFLGCEVFQNGVGTTCYNANKRELNNIKIFHGDVRILFNFIPKATIERFYILFPDPWPKKRHNMRRLLNYDNLENICFLLKSGGKVCIATDVLDYKNQILELFERIKFFQRVKFNSKTKNNEWFLEKNTKWKKFIKIRKLFR